MLQHDFAAEARREAFCQTGLADADRTFDDDKPRSVTRFFLWFLAQVRSLFQSLDSGTISADLRKKSLYAAAAGHVHVRGQVSEREQYKISLRDARVRNAKVRLIDDQAAEDQKIEVEDTRPPVRRIAPSALSFLDCLQSAHKLMRPQPREHDGSRVHEVGLA
jgi:hypothetical protein